MTESDGYLLGRSASELDRLRLQAEIYAPHTAHLLTLAGIGPDGKAPVTLPAASADGTSTRDLCAYPMVSRYAGGDPSVAASYHCTR